MTPFGQKLSDEQAAALLSFARNRGAMPLRGVCFVRRTPIHMRYLRLKGPDEGARDAGFSGAKPRRSRSH